MKKNTLFQTAGNRITVPKITVSKITVLGLSRSGVAAALLLQQKGLAVFVTERNPLSPANQAFADALTEANIPFEVGGHTQLALQGSVAVVSSPGIPPTAALFAEAERLGLPVFSEVDVARAFAPEQVPWVGITGTNGKTTITHWVHYVLTRALGWNAPLCGNVGFAVCDVLRPYVEKPEPEERTPTLTPEFAAFAPPLDALVVELSSYQLALSQPLGVDVAVLTHIKPDHLAWHGSFEAYREAKLKLFTGEEERPAPRWAVLNAEEPTTPALLAERNAAGLLSAVFSAQPKHALLSQATVALWWEPGTGLLMAQAKPEASSLGVTMPLDVAVVVMPTANLKLLGTHNIENALATLAVGLIYGAALPALAEALSSFKGVEHRLEFVAELPVTGVSASVAVYNDSKATNPEASEQALMALTPRPLVLLAGGEDKGTDLSAWAKACLQHATQVVLYGKAKQRLAEALQAVGHKQVLLAEHMQAAWQLALEQLPTLTASLPKEASAPAILLSPACASFDAFANFEERGTVFKALVTDEVNHQLKAASKGLPKASPPLAKEATV